MSSAIRGEAGDYPATRFVLSEDLELPIGAVVETFAVLGMRGSGKTSTAVVMAEEMVGAGMPVVVIDPLGVWWGLRSSADGKGEGLPVVIFGGDHADVPLSEGAGEVIADTLVASRFPAILDVSGLSRPAMRRFMADFFERLYAKNREALHIIVDEADLLVPQRLPAKGLRLFNALDDIQRRGRARGLGTTLITQRPAVISKDLLSQAEVLVAMSFRNKRDVAAIDDWVRLKADEAEAEAVKASLASLPVGCGWVWSPSLLGVLAKVQIRPRWTFDSSATPKPGQPRPVAEAFAMIDTAALGARIEAMAEEATASDPSRLRAEIQRLQKENESLRRGADRKDRPAGVVEVPVEVRVEVPVLSEGDRDLLARVLEATSGADDRVADALAESHRLLERSQAERETLRDAVLGLTENVNGLVNRSTPTNATNAVAPRTGRPTLDRPRLDAPTPDSVAAPPAPAAASRVRSPRAQEVDDEKRMSKAERLILTVLAQQPGRTAVQVAILTGYSHKSGGFRNALASLRTKGYIVGAGPTGLDATEAGLEALGPYDALPTGAALREWWKGRHLGKAERGILDVIAEAYPHAVPVDEIAERTGYSPTSGGFRNALSKLRSLQLAHSPQPKVLALSESLAD